MPPTPTSSTGNGGQHATNHSMSITYTSTSSFLDSPLCSHFVSALSNQFPLRNVPHRSASPSASSSTIQSLPTRLIPLADELLKAKHKPETRHLLQANLLERPFAHVFLVATADSDFYRTQVRNEIRNWLTTIKDTPTLHAYSATDDTADTTSSPDTNSQDDTPEYLIVYITPPSGYNTLPSAQGYFAQGPQGSRPGTPSTNSPAANSPAANDEQPVSTPKTGINKFLSGASSKSSATKDPTGGVLDKLKTDFGGKQSDRIVHISRLPAPTATSGSVSLSASHVTDPTIFTPLTTAFKTSLAHTLEMAIKSQRAQANKLKALRSVTGWNPVNVFGKLECLGNTFESVGLYEEAIQCFDDLDALYKDCLRDGELTFFPSITPTSLSQGQDDSSILSTSSKPYREMILHSSASLWDLKLYLLSRRLLLLSKMGRGIAMIRETMTWLGETTLLVAQQGIDLPPHCLAAFVFSACFDVLHHCITLFLSPSGTLTSTTDSSTDAVTAALSTPAHDLNRLPAPFHSITCDLLQLALAQLDKIGIGFEYLPPHRPFAHTPHQLKTRETTGIANAVLLNALPDEAAFLHLYLQLTDRILDSQARSGRNRSRKSLLAKLACLDMHRGRTQEAYQAFCELVDGHAQRWDDLEAFLLRRQLECHSRLDKPKNRQWVAAIVNLLRTSSPQDNPDDGDAHKWTSESDLFQKLHKASWDFEREVPVSGFTKLSVVAASSRRAHNLRDQDGVQLDVHVFSTLSEALQVDDVRFCLIGGGGAANDDYPAQREQQIWLTSGPVTISPNGRTDVQLRSFSSAPGKYILDVSQIRFGKIVFQNIAPKALSAGSSTGSSSAISTMAATTVITIPHDGHALTAKLDQPNRIALDQSRFGEVTIDTGRNHVTSATVKLSHLDTRPLMGFGAAEIIDVKRSPCSAANSATSLTPHLEPTSDGLSISLTSLPPHHSIKLRFPLDEAPPSDGSAMPLLIEVDYHSEGPSVKQRRSLRAVAELVIALPLGVNVQDFFRLQSLFCKFAISVGGGGALKVRRAVLRHADNEDEDGTDKPLSSVSTHPSSSVTVTCPPSSSVGKRVTVITPRQPASFVFQIQRQGKKSRDPLASSTTLRLFLTYRTLHEDARVIVERLALRRLQDKYDETALPLPIRPLLLKALASLTDQTLDVPVFALTGAVRLDVTASYWAQTCRDWDVPPKSTVAKAVVQFAKEVVEECASAGPDDAPSTSEEDLSAWRVLEIPVEVPQMDIVNQVHLKLLHGDDAGGQQPPALTVGTPVEVQITIDSTFAWGEEEEATAPLPAPASTATSESGHTLAPASSPTREADESTTDAGSLFQDAMSDVTATGGGGARANKANANTNANANANAKPLSSSSAPTHTHKTQRMSYEVQADFENWLVSGSKRGVWTLDSSSSSRGKSTHHQQQHSFKLTLVPLRAGSLTMPNVSVTPLQPAPVSLPVSFAHHHHHHQQGQHQQGHTTTSPLPTSETYVENVAQRVFVFPGAGGGHGEKATQGETFWVPESSSPTSASAAAV